MADKGASNLSAVLAKFKSGQRATLKVQAEARQERDERLAAKPASAAPPGTLPVDDDALAEVPHFCSSVDVTN